MSSRYLCMQVFSIATWSGSRFSMTSLPTVCTLTDAPWRKSNLIMSQENLSAALWIGKYPYGFMQLGLACIPRSSGALPFNTTFAHRRALLWTMKVKVSEVMLKLHIMPLPEQSLNNRRKHRTLSF